MSTLFGIGVGVGDFEDLTLKAVRIIKECEVIFLPNKDKEKCVAYKIVKQAISEIDSKILIFCDFPMTKDKKILENAQNEVAKKICEYLAQNKNVAFLTIGDPTIYSTFMYIDEKVKNSNFETQIINGITSFCAVASKLGISLSSQNEEIHIIPATYEIENSFNLKGTLIFMKSGKKLAELKEFLMKQKESHNFEFYAVSNCGLENEIICKKLEELNVENYLTVVIVKLI